MLLAGMLLGCSLQAKEYVVPAGVDVGEWFATLPKDATSVVFSEASRYHSKGDIVLPETTLLVIDGRGSKLSLGSGSRGFTSAIRNQDHAMVHASYRYRIKDFATISGGRKAIDLKASLGSIIENLELAGQSEAAIDIRFGLLTRVNNIRVTNPKDKGIVVRQGDWPGATATNSQSNHTVLNQCRIYCSKTTTSAFTVLNSNGVRMQDCVSEGDSADYDVFLSATMDGDESRPATNPVVKSFILSNFHVEHPLRKASIYVNMPAQASVNLDNVYWNGPQEVPVILYTRGQVNLTSIGWWRHRIGSRVSAPRINITQAPYEMNLTDKGVEKNKVGFIQLVDPLPGNTQLKLNYVKVRWGSI